MDEMKKTSNLAIREKNNELLTKQHHLSQAIYFTRNSIRTTELQLNKQTTEESRESQE